MKLRYTLILIGAVLLIGLTATFLLYTHQQDLTRYAEPETSKGINLPFAPDALVMDGGHMASLITIGSNNDLRYNGSQITESDLKKMLIKKYAKYGQYPVGLFVDKDLTMKEVWKYIRLCREKVGIWRFNVAAIIDDTPRLPVLGSIELYAPITEGNKKHKGPVVIKGDMDDILNIHMGRDGIALQGKLISLKTLEKQLSRLAGFSKDISVLILLTDDVVYQDLVDVLNACVKSGLDNVNITDADGWDKAGHMSFEEDEPSPELPKWTYSGYLHKRIKSATILQVTSSQVVKKSETNRIEVVHLISTPTELDKLLKNLEFVKQSNEGHCRCSGERTFKWFKNDELLAVSTLHHDTHMRWEESLGDAYLTKASRNWLKMWLIKHDRKFINTLRDKK